MVSPALFALVRCPDCDGDVAAPPDEIHCHRCGRRFEVTDGVLDLRPRAQFTEQTKYLDEALHADARHARVAPPLLGSKVRQDMLRTMLAPGPGDRILDLGCGNGRTLAWNADSGAQLVGIDIAPYFAREARDRSDLLLGDLRRLPIRDGAFTKAWALDVLEHLSPEALRNMLAESNRILADGGRLFVYTHVRKNGWPAVGVRAANRVAKWCERLGLLDLRLERLRKSDHLNPIADHAELAAVVNAAGFRLERVTYYSPVIGAFVENVLVRLAERWLVKSTAKRTPGGSGDEEGALREVRSRAQARVRQGGAAYRVAAALSAVMKIDIWLFGRIPTGPFFAVLRKAPTASPSTSGVDAKNHVDPRGRQGQDRVF